MRLYSIYVLLTIKNERSDDYNKFALFSQKKNLILYIQKVCKIP